jgi:hypothetical protein
VTIYYPDIVPTYWQYICGALSEVQVDIKITDIPQSMRGDYLKDREFKIEFQEQLNQLWIKKDQLLQQFFTDTKPKV